MCAYVIKQVTETETYFETVVKAGGLMDVNEWYYWDGSEKTFKRRDKRRGPEVVSVTRCSNGHPVIRCVEEPC